jgi:hypothetical protein
MLETRKSITVNGSIKVKTDGGDIEIVTVSASINENGSINKNEYIKNKELYMANMETVSKDTIDFGLYINRLMGE